MDALLLDLEQVFCAHDPFHFGVGLQFVKLADDARQDLVQFRIRDLVVKAMAIPGGTELVSLEVTLATEMDYLTPRSKDAKKKAKART